MYDLYVDRLTSRMFVDCALYFEEDQMDQRTRRTRTRNQGFTMVKKIFGVALALPRWTKWTTLMKVESFGKIKRTIIRWWLYLVDATREEHKLLLLLNLETEKKAINMPSLC